MIAIRKLNGDLRVNVDINEGSTRRVELMKEDYIKLKFSLNKPIALEMGDYVDFSQHREEFPYLFDLARYELTTDYQPTYNVTTGGYDYDLQLDAEYMKWKNKIFKYQPKYGGREASWSLTAKPSVFLSLIEKNIKSLGYKHNNADYLFGFRTADDIKDYDQKVINLSFSDTNIIDALTEIAEACDPNNNTCSWWFDNGWIYFGRCEVGVRKDLEIGVNVYSMTPSEGQEDRVNRIYAFGSERNISGRYRKDLIFTATQSTEVQSADGEDSRYAVLDEFRILNARMFKDSTKTIVERNYVDIPKKSKSSAQHLTSSEANGDFYYDFSTESFSAVFNNTNAKEGEFSARAGKVETKITTKIYVPFKVEGGLTLDVVGDSKKSETQELTLARIEDTDGGTTFSGECDATALSVYDAKETNYSVSASLSVRLCLFPDMNAVKYGNITMIGSLGGTALYTADYRFTSSVTIHFADGSMVDVHVVDQSTYDEMLSQGNNFYKVNVTDIFKCGNEYYSLARLFSITQGGMTQLVCDYMPVSFSYSIDFLKVGVTNYSVHTKLTTLDENYNPIKTYDVSLNPFAYSILEDEAKYIAFDSDHPLVSKFKFKLAWYEDGIEKTDLILGRVSEGYFTNKYAYNDEADAKYLSGAVVTNLMLPDRAVYKNTDGSLTFTPTGTMVYDGSGRISEDVPEEMVREKVVIFDDVYPTYVSHVSDVMFTTTDQTDDKTGEKTGVTLYEYTFKDKNFPNFTKKDFVSEKIYVTFADVTENGIFHSGGKLNGMTFELGIVKTDNTGTTFNIIRNMDSSVPLPNEILFPQDGDGYNIYGFDTSFVDETLTEKAELELVRQSLVFIERSNRDMNTYSCVMMSDDVYMDNLNHYMYRIGDAVRLVNPQLFGEEGRNSRIIAVEHKLDFPFDAPTLTVGETSEFSTIGALQSSITELNFAGSAVNINVSGGSSSIYVVKRNDRVSASDTNVFSASRTLEEIEKSVKNLLGISEDNYLRKDRDDSTEYSLTMGNARVKDTLTTNHIKSDNGTLVVDSDVEMDSEERTWKTSNIYGVQNSAINFNDSVKVHRDSDIAMSLNGGIGHKDFIPDVLTGDKWQIDEDGNAELQSLIIREFLEVPELRYNRVTVQSGTTWNASGAGIIKRVGDCYYDENLHTTCGYFELKLEEGEIGSFVVNDICMGIWHFSDEPLTNLANLKEGESYTSMSELNAKEDGTGANAGLVVSGFTTIYFTVLEVLDYIEVSQEITEGAKIEINPDTNLPVIIPPVTREITKTYTNGKVKFALRNDANVVTKALPQKAMAIVGYGNTQDPLRQTSSYTTRTFTRYLRGINSFDIPFSKIVMHIGDMTDMHITTSKGIEVALDGYSAYLNNIYMSGTIEQFDMIEELINNYLIEFSKHNEIITLDNEGNIVGGLVNSDNGYTTYSVYTAVTVMKGDKYLTLYDEENHESRKGHYTISAQGNGCEVEVDSSTIRVTSIHGTRTDKTGVWTDEDYEVMRNLDNCSVDVYVMCEDGSAITRTFYLTIKHLEDPIFTIDMDNPNASISWNTRTRSYTGFPINTNIFLFRNSTDIDITKVEVVAQDEDDNTLFDFKADESGTIQSCPYLTIIRETEGGVFKRYNSLITFHDSDSNNLASTLPDKFFLRFKVGVHYCGVDYIREAVMTIHKSEDSNIYQLKPSVAQFRASWDGTKWVFNAETLTCDVECIPLSGEPYRLTATQRTEREIVVKYKTDIMTSAQTLSSLAISSSIKNIHLELFEKDYSWDTDDIPVNFDGVDGSDTENIFFRQDSWRGYSNNASDLATPQIYNTDKTDINGKDFQSDGYLPYAENNTGSSAKHWTDTPSGIDGTHVYEFYAQRKKIKGVWQPFGDVHLWNNFAKNGNKGDNAVVYELVPQSSSVRIDRTGTLLTGNSIACKVLRTSGESKSFLDVNTSDGLYELQCYIDGTKVSVNVDTLTPQIGNVTVHDTNTTIQWRLYDKDNKAIIDYQDIPVLHEGANGIMVYVENQNINIPTDFDGAITASSNAEVKFHLYSGTEEADDIKVVVKGSNDAITSNAVVIDDTSFDGTKLISWNKGIKFATTAIKFTVSSAKMGVDLDTTVNIIANKTGADGAGREMVFFIQDDWKEEGGTTPTPKIYKGSAYPSYVKDGKTITYDNDDYLPFTDNSKSAQWVDDPPKVDSSHRYVFYSTRRKINNKWQDFDEVGLWNKFTKDGVDNLYAKADIERIDISCDVEGKARATSSKDIVFHLYKGEKEITIKKITAEIQGYSGNGCSITDYTDVSKKTFGWSSGWAVVECDIKATVVGSYKTDDTGVDVQVTRYLSIGIIPSVGGEAGVSPVIRELVPEQTVLSFDEYGKALFANSRFSCRAISIRGEVQTPMFLGTDYFIKYSYNGGGMTNAYLTTSTDKQSMYGEFGKSGFTAKMNTFTWYLVDKTDNILDYQSVLVNHAASGVVRCFAINDNINIPCNDNGNVSDDAPSTITLIFNATKGIEDYSNKITNIAVNTELTGSYASVGQSINYGSKNNNTFTLNITKGKPLIDGTIYFTLTYGEIVTFTQDVAVFINAIKQGQTGVPANAYELVPLQRALLYNNGEPSISKIECKAMLTQGTNDPVYINFSTNTKVKLQCDVTYRTSRNGSQVNKVYTIDGANKFTLSDNNTVLLNLTDAYYYDKIEWQLLVNGGIVDSQGLFIAVGGDDAISAYVENSNINIPLNNEHYTQKTDVYKPKFHMYVGAEEMTDITITPPSLFGTGLTWDTENKQLGWSANTSININLVTFSIYSTKAGVSRNVSISINAFTEGTNGEDGVSLNDNLIYDANFAQGQNSKAWNVFLASNTIFKGGILGLNIVKSDSTVSSSTIDFMHQKYNGRVVSGQWYTLSFYASGSYLMVSLGLSVNSSKTYNGNGIYAISADIVPSLNGTTMKKYIYSFFVDSVGESAYITFKSKGGYYAQVSAVKLEEGQSGSAFALSPVDTEAYRIIKTEYYYALSTSSSSVNIVGGYNWSTTKYPSNGYFLWRYSVETLSNGTYTYTRGSSSDAICLSGERGLTGATMRGPVIWQQGITYVNNTTYIDVVRYTDGNYYAVKAPANGNLERTTTSIPTTTTDWEKFQNMKPIATSMILADEGYMDVLGAGSVFIGANLNDVEYNADGTRNIKTTATGWQITAGAITHTKTGVSLTADGKLYDPNGLHIKVGNGTLKDLSRTNPNYLFNPIFAIENPYTSGMWGESIRDGLTNVSLNWLENSGTIYSPWLGDDGRILRVYISSNFCTTDKSIYARQNALTSPYRTQLVAGRKYTFSVWVKLPSNDTNYIPDSRLVEISLWNSATATANADRTTNYVRYDVYADEIDGWRQYYVTFTPSGGNVYFTWIPLFFIKAMKSGFAVCYAGVKLEEGEIPTAMTYTSSLSASEIQGMGFVNEEGLDNAINERGLLTAKQLLDTGIDVLSGKILATANNFTIQNNYGERTLYLNENGDLNISGYLNSSVKTIRTKEDYLSLIFPVNNIVMASNIASSLSTSYVTNYTENTNNVTGYPIVVGEDTNTQTNNRLDFNKTWGITTCQYGMLDLAKANGIINFEGVGVVNHENYIYLPMIEIGNQTGTNNSITIEYNSLAVRLAPNGQFYSGSTLFLSKDTTVTSEVKNFSGYNTFALTHKAPTTSITKGNQRLVPRNYVLYFNLRVKTIGSVYSYGSESMRWLNLSNKDVEISTSSNAVVKYSYVSKAGVRGEWQTLSGTAQLNNTDKFKLFARVEFYLSDGTKQYTNEVQIAQYSVADIKAYRTLTTFGGDSTHYVTYYEMLNCVGNRFVLMNNTPNYMFVITNGNMVENGAYKNIPTGNNMTSFGIVTLPPLTSCGFTLQVIQVTNNSYEYGFATNSYPRLCFVPDDFTISTLTSSEFMSETFGGEVYI